MTTCLKLLILACIICAGQSARILAVFDMPSPSHYILGEAYLKGLAEAGHDVTMVSPFKIKNPPKNGSYRDIVLTGMAEEHEEKMKAFHPFSKIMNNPLAPLLMVGMISKMSGFKLEKFFSHPNVEKLLKSDEKFDVIVLEQFFNDGLKVLGHHFNAPVILFSTQGGSAVINPLMGTPTPSSYIPNSLLNVPRNMNFFQRLINTVFDMIYVLAQTCLGYPDQRAIIQKYFPNAPPFDQMLYNSSLLFLNSHESFHNSVPSVPNVVNIGGFHVQPPKKLPSDLQKFLDDATEGVVFFSLGSNVKSKDLPEETRNAILNTFGKLKQKVLWKWEADTLPGQPPNVKLGKWLPQQDILAHPNVKVFITHGGLLSTIETVYHGVPIVAIPLFADQKMNARGAEEIGYGLVMPFIELSEEKLTKLLNEVLTNPKFAETAKSRSRIMHDRQRKPLDSAIYWTEYVIRHGGAKHLRVAGLDLAWYQYYLLDVFAFILAILVGVIFAIKVLCKLGCKLVCKLCCKSKVQPQKLKKN